MNLLTELHALAEKWHKQAAEDQSGTTGFPFAKDQDADELTELLGKVVVTDEMVEKAIDVFQDNKLNGVVYRKCVRAALESTLGVTK
jgi:hypothetical protein